MKTYISTLSALAVATSLSLAQDKPAGPPRGPGGPNGPKRPAPEEVYKKLDANADGSVTLDEFKAGPRAGKDPDKAAEIYKKIDANADGSVTLEEFKAFRPPHRPGGPGGPGGPGKGGKGKGGPTPPTTTTPPVE
jgi:hypothetical protein